MSTIVKKSELKDHLEIKGIGRDAKVASLVAGMNDFIDQYTGREWEQVAHTERYPGPGGRVLVLRNYPVTVVTTLTEDGQTIDPTLSTEVELDKDRGIIYRTGGVWVKSLERIYSVTYTGGPSRVPLDLKLAALEMCAYLWRSSGGRREYTTGTVINKLFFDTMTKLPGVHDLLDKHRDSARGMVQFT